MSTDKTIGEGGEESSTPTTQFATISVDGFSDDWSSLTPTFYDPAGDTVCGTTTDFERAYTAIDDNFVYIMVETYFEPIHPTATLEMNFSFVSGALHTNISDTEVFAWKPYPDEYPINGEVVIRGNVMEVSIPRSELENTSFFNVTFLNIWDGSACDSSN